MKSFNNHVSRIFSKRALAITGTALLLGGCSVIPKTGPAETTGPIAGPTPEPSATALPTDATRHRVALLVPMGGNTAAVGQSLANATTMALLDTNANNIRITTYDTSKGAGAAARKAIADGNKLILGPLLADNVPAVQAAARPARVPAIAFSNDIRVASADVFLMGHVPEQSINRSVQYARARGSNNFAAIVPEGAYGQRSFDALNSALSQYGGTLIGSAKYARGNTSIVSAAQRLRAAGGYDTVLIADGARLATQAAGEIKRSGAEGTRILGTELWSGESVLTRSSAVNGAIFSAVSDRRYKRFADSYEARFGNKPYRIATLGYDSVLLTLRVARDWRVGRNFPTSMLFDKGGFLGVDGPFRFNRTGIAERALEVREVRGSSVVSVDAAPTSFSD
uniref:penicillin-binding protein activator n=1 Tax=uncultured Erythrobacter sp. TaxID=263913 RepID=UPI002614FC54|nr:penicillin-binding protein activator [uncultured Erythrobacter sp.]